MKSTLRSTRTLKTSPAKISFLMQTRNVIRDFVFGMEDGLVSNLGLVLGVYIGGGTPFDIVLAGLASMFAGAFSMSAGSYLSAKSQREVYEQEIKATKEKLRRNPQACLREMCELLQDEGYDEKEVALLCTHFTKHNKLTFIRDYIQKKVGLSEFRFELPFRNAAMMFLSFLLGSAFPIVPFIFWDNGPAAITASVLTMVLLFMVGLTKTYFTKRNWFKSGIEMVLVGAGAGAIGYIVGLLLSMVR